MSSRWLSTFESDLPRLVGDLEALVRLESPSGDAARVSRIAAWVHDTLRERGVPAELRPCPSRGDALLASVVFREGGTLLLGHLDTVWPAGTLAELPWRLDGGRAQGPGVFDMKAGIVVGMAVLTAMVRESRPHPVSLLLVPDEEAGSGASRELTLSVARRHRRVLVLEPSQDGAAKVARKGCGTFEIRFRGRAAHAGLEPEKGASALAEMARFVLFLDSLADAGQGHDAHRERRPVRQRDERRPRGGGAGRGRPGLDARGGGARDRGDPRLPPGRPAGERLRRGRPRPTAPRAHGRLRRALRRGPPAGRGPRLRAGRGAGGRGFGRQLHRGGRDPHARRPRAARGRGARPRRARARRGPAGAGGPPGRPRRRSPRPGPRASRSAARAAGASRGGT